MSVQMTLFWKALTFLRAVDIFDYFFKKRHNFSMAAYGRITHVNAASF